MNVFNGLLRFRLFRRSGRFYYRSAGKWRSVDGVDAYFALRNLDDWDLIEDTKSLRVSIDPWATETRDRLPAAMAKVFGALPKDAERVCLEFDDWSGDVMDRHQWVSDFTATYGICPVRMSREVVLALILHEDRQKIRRAEEYRWGAQWANSPKLPPEWWRSVSENDDEALAAEGIHSTFFRRERGNGAVE